MDPLHITEFASPRYFDKLRSLNEAADNPNASASSETHATENAVDIIPGSVPSPSSTLVIPLGNPRPLTARRRRSNDGPQPTDQKRRLLGHDLTPGKNQRRPSFTTSFLTFRPKIPITSKSSHVDVEHEEYIGEATPVKEHLTLGELFLNLPNELQLQIISPLPVPSILNVRLVSKSFHTLITLNESPIARYHITHSIPAYALKLYPVPDPSQITLHYLCGLWHRLHVATKLSVLIAEHTTREIFLRNSEVKRLEFQPQHNRMRRRLMPLLFTMFHFFEKYRELHIQHLATNGVPLCLQPFTLNPIERQVMDIYDDETLLNVHQVFPLVLSSFSRRLRPPSYAGRLERSIKGYLKDKPADEIYATILDIGGLHQAERFWETKGYNSRRAAVDSWYGHITREPVEPAGKSKLAMIAGLGRKKPAAVAEVTSTEHVDTHEAAVCNSWHCVKPSCVDARRHRPTNDLIFHTSLAQGPPMSPLPRDQLRLLLSDQQPLTNIWLHTAEAVILDRQIVENSQKIKRNTQVLLELIREDGTLIDEEWTPGTLNLSNHPLSNFQGVDNLGGASDL